MRLPRDVSGRQIAALLSRRGYTIARQKSSHLRLTNTESGTHSITIPDLTRFDLARLARFSATLRSIFK